MCSTDFHYNLSLPSRGDGDDVDFMPSNDRHTRFLGTALYLAYLKAEADYPLRRETHRYSALHRDPCLGVKLSKNL